MQGLASGIGAGDPRFQRLQDRLRAIMPLQRAGLDRPATIVSIPSLGLGARYLARSDLASLETRWMYLLLLLDRPLIRVAIVTSQTIGARELDYYLDLIPTAPDPRRRLALFAPDDPSPRPLADKLLEHPDLLAEIRAFVGACAPACILPFAVGASDREVAVALDMPIAGIDDRFARYATKSGARRLFAAAKVTMPTGEQDLAGEAAVVAAVGRLRRRQPGVRSAVVKLDEGVTGDGNALLALGDLPAPGDPGEHGLLAGRVGELPAPYRAALAEGAVVEELIEAQEIHSPSVQIQLDPDAEPRVLSTHDQILGGPLGHTFLGCRFPADRRYGPAIVADAVRAAREISADGAIGRLAIDFVVARSRGAWSTFAVEVNLREGATTHPTGTLMALVSGRFDPATGLYTAADGRAKFYEATDALGDPDYRGVPFESALAAAAAEGLAYDPSRQTGVVFYMLRALAISGRLSIVAIADSAQDAADLHTRTGALLDRLAAAG